MANGDYKRRQRFIHVVGWIFLLTNELQFVATLAVLRPGWRVMLKTFFHISQMAIWTLVLSGYIQPLGPESEPSGN